MQQCVQAALRTGYGQFAVVLLVLLLLVSGGYTVAKYGATSMEISAWKNNTDTQTSTKIFDKTFTDLGLVHDAQVQLVGSPLWPPIGGGCANGPTVYVYQFSFATFGVTTQVYNGNYDYGAWNAATLGIGPLGDVNGFGASQVHVAVVTLDGTDILTALHQRTGMPLPVG